MLLLGHDPASREYVLDRLDRDHILALAAQAKSALFDYDKAVELCYQPGDATWYSIIIAPVAGVFGAPGGGSGDDYVRSYIGATKTATYVIVYAQRGQAVWCTRDDSMEWIASKFDVTEASQLAIAELLHEVFSA